MNNVLIKVYYGPYEANGIIRHKIQKVYGLITYLKTNKYNYETYPSPLLNRLSIEMNDRVIYTGDIRYMKFNIPFEDDLLCKRIVDVIKLHQLTFEQERNIPKFPLVSEGMRLQRQQDIEGSYMEDSSISEEIFNKSLNLQIDNEEEGEAWGSTVMDALHNWDKDTFMKHYVFNYGSFMQEPLESDQSNVVCEQLEEASVSTTTPTSCICLSVDPPSLYSVCHGPPTPFNTEVSQKDIVQPILTELVDDLTEKMNKDLNKVAKVNFSTDEWKDILFLEDGRESQDDTDADEELNEIEKILHEEGFEMDLSSKSSTFTNDRNASFSKTGLTASLESQEDIEFTKIENEEEPTYSLYNKASSLDKAIKMLQTEIKEYNEPTDEKYKNKVVRSKVCHVFTGGKCSKN